MSDPLRASIKRTLPEKTRNETQSGSAVQDKGITRRVAPPAGESEDWPMKRLSGSGSGFYYFIENTSVSI